MLPRRNHRNRACRRDAGHLLQFKRKRRSIRNNERVERRDRLIANHLDESARLDDQLRRHREVTRRCGCVTCGRRRQRGESGGDHRALSSRHRRVGIAHRLRRRPRSQDVADRPRAALAHGTASIIVLTESPLGDFSGFCVGCCRGRDARAGGARREGGRLSAIGIRERLSRRETPCRDGSRSPCGHRPPPGFG